MVALLGACGDATDPAAKATLTGNFAGHILGTDDPLAVSLREDDGTVSGHAWSALNSFLIRGTNVSGSLQGNVVTLRLSRTSPPLDEWTLTGEFLGDTIRGNFARNGLLVEMVRIDTVASGVGIVDVRGDTAGNATGTAVFNHGTAASAFRLLLATDPPFRANLIVVLHNAGGLPAAGSYTVANSGAVFDIGGRGYFSTSGVVRIERSNRYAVFGVLDLTAKTAAGDSVAVSATFSAGCGGIC